jgi:hypothetical protein
MANILRIDRAAHRPLPSDSERSSDRNIRRWPSSPGSLQPGGLAAARLVAEIGDDSTPFADARGLKVYPGAAPVTRASGKKLILLHRKVKTQRLAAGCYLWTLAAVRLSTGARAHYDRRRVAGDRHTAPFQRFLGCLYDCLQTGRT